MIHFAQAQYLFLILVIPFFFVGYALFRRERNRKIAKIGSPELMAALMPNRSRAKGWVRISFFAVAWFFFAIGLARPQMGAKIKESNRKGAEIMIALDVSNSILAQDYSPNRLERAKLAISRLVDKLHGDRIGLIVFAGQSFVQLPITTDYVSAKIFLNTIGTESVPVQGTALGEAINTAIKSFSSEAQMQQNNKAIILITDGENHEDDPVEAARMAAEVGIKVFCIGVGSPEGKPIPYGPDGELMKDREGNIVVTKLDEKILEEVAAAGEGAYIRAGNAEFGLNPIIDELKQLEEQQFRSIVFEDFEEQYMYFFAIALVFFLLEFLVGNKRVGKKMFAVVLLLMVSAVSSYAQTDKNEVRKGNRLYKDGNYKEAEVEYRKALIKDSLSLAGNYNLANVMMQQEDAANAELIYAKLGDTISKIPQEVDWKNGSVKVDRKNTLPPDYYHNLGNSFLAQKKYQEAVDAYKNALRRNPGDNETRENYIYAKKKLEDGQNQDQQQQQQQQDQNQQNQNQDQQQQQNQQDQQNQNQDQQNDNKDQNQDKNNNPDKDQQDKQDQQQNGNQPKISPQAAEQMLQAMQEKENQTQEKVKEEKAKALKSKQKEKNW
ncbi:MAG: VWA domain-containing protein [Bacteroidales bacterium]|nr:VWA domain-containing protein [Bacteroidales bacterium]